MQTRVKLSAFLRRYRDMQTSINILQYRLRQQEGNYSILTDDGIAGEQLAGKPITDMPIAHGVTPGSTIERIVLLREKAKEAHLDAIVEDAKKLESLLRQKEETDIALKGLTERERYVLVGHLMNGITWERLTEQFIATFSMEITYHALRYTQDCALDKMVAILNEMNGEMCKVEFGPVE